MREILTEQDRKFLIEALQNGEDIPLDFKYKMFPTNQKEYELIYGGKMRKEDILSSEDGIFPVPLQIEKVFNGERDIFADGWKNLIVFGDNLQFLKTIYENKDPLIKDKVKGKVKLIYIDPPFATESDFRATQGQKAYSDKIKGAEFIEFIRRRLIVAKELLSEEGNIVVHLDNKKSHYIKLVLDEIFGESNFINEIIWYKGREGGSSRSHSSSSSMPTEYQNILIYSKNRNQRFWNPILGPYKDSTVKDIKKDERGWYYGRGRMGRKPAEWEIEEGKGLKTYVYDDPTKSKEEVLKIITTKGAEFVSVGDVWDKNFVKFSQTTKYPTEKPEDLIKYIINAATKEDDIVLDFFGGSGTTAAVAEKLKRKWITCDIGKLAFYTIQKRILNIQTSKDLEKITKKYNKISKSFVTVNTGIYDLEKVFALEKDEYRKFVMELFDIEPVNKKINGITIDGEKSDGYDCIIYPYWDFKDAQVDEEYLEDLHSHIGNKIGNRLYIIAPSNSVYYFSNYQEIGNIRYYFLKVPYQIIKELHKVKFKKFRQPQSKNNINDLENTIGFHFIRPPQVSSTLIINNDKVSIKLSTFFSVFSEEETGNMKNFESLSMILVDLNYNRKQFEMDSYFFAEDLLPKKSKNVVNQKTNELSNNEENEEIHNILKNQQEIIIPEFDKASCGERIMVIYVDIYGNEFKEEFSI